MIVGAEKSHGMPSASRRTKKASDVILSMSKDLRTWGGGWGEYWCSPEPDDLRSRGFYVHGQEKMGVPGQEERQQACFSFSFSQTLSGVDNAHRHW